MSSTVRDIESQARQLPLPEREQLAKLIFESLHHQEINDVDRDWIAVAEERMNAYRSGKDPGLTEDAFLRTVGNELGWK